MKLTYASLIMLLVVALSIFTYYVYQYLTRPTYCMCPAVLLDNVYNTYVYYGGKLIYHGWYFEAWPVPAAIISQAYSTNNLRPNNQ